MPPAAERCCPVRSTRRHSASLVAFLAAAASVCALLGAQEGEAPANAQEPAFFEEKVAPILERNCFACHGPLRQRGGLRLDSRPAMLLGGASGAAIVPGSAEESLLIQAVKREGGLEMPPPRSLSGEEITTLAAWLDAGATWTMSREALELGDGVVEITTREVPPVQLDVAPGDDVAFNRQIRPILSKHCYECHGPDEEARQAGLRLDTPEGATAELPSGRFAIVAGDLARSQLFQRVAAVAPEDRMPPYEAGGHGLDAEEVALLAQFILQGAPFQPHWAFVPPERSTPPTFSQPRDRAWPRNAIDRFVLARLHAEGLEPSAPADRRTLVRRVSLDLTGLPPTPEETESFVADTRVDAYERLVDRLLASERYGEHAARYWLDAARYADTNGYHIDNERFMWRWREWVIEAFNDNQPFDQFTTEQLAGDLLPEPSLRQQIATGFHRNHMINFEGGAIPEEYRTQYVFDRVDTTATVWLGLTVGCAKCHDHKFDPVSQREYYQLAAFFNSIEEEGLDGFTGNARPYLPAPDASQLRAERELLDALEPLYRLLDDPNRRVDEQMSAWRERWARELGEKWQTLEPSELSSKEGAEFERKADGSVLVTGENPANDTLEVVAEIAMEGIKALRLEALRDEALPKGGIGRSVEDGTFTLTDLEVEVAPPGQSFPGEPIRFSFAFADHRHPFTPVRLAIDDDEASGWSADFAGKETKRTAVFLTEQPFDAPAGSRIRIRLHHQSTFAQRVIGRFRLSVSSDQGMTLSRRGGWSWSGPYPSFEPPQEAPKPDLDARHGDGRLKWVTAFPGKGAAEEPFRDSLTLPAGASRLIRIIEAPTDRVATYQISADGFRLWLNGELQDECLPGEQPVPARDCRATETELELGQGRNELYAVVWVATPPESPPGAASDALPDAPSASVVELEPFELSLEQETVGSLPFWLETLLTTVDEQLTEAEVTSLRRHYRRTRWPRFEREEARFVALEAQLEALREEIPTTMVMSDREEPRPTFVLRRGQYDLHGEQVEAATPAVLPPLPTPSGGATRLDLARWLVDPAHPLTARVAVNRFWQRFFGHGLVKTSEDFGTQGQLPSHPQLLDWLATEFVRSGWDLKALQRLIVTSATYRQSSRVSPELLARDPENRLLARASRFRLDAEVLRDSALAYGGLLVEKLGGPGVSPYQPPGLWKEIGYESRGRFSAGEFVRGSGDDLYRRSLYTFWKRTVPPPNMLVFDAPNRETCTVKRGTSNTPLQALTLLNDPQYVEAARSLAQRLLLEGSGDLSERLARAFQIVLARAPTAAEIGALGRLVDEQLAHFRSEPEAVSQLLSVGDAEVPPSLDRAELAAWSVLASVVLNLDETLNRS